MSSTQCIFCGHHIDTNRKQGVHASLKQIEEACQYHDISCTPRYMICNTCRRHPPQAKENKPPQHTSQQINTMANPHEQQLVTNVKNMMASMPTHAHLRQPLVQILSHDIPNRVAATMLSTSSSKVNKAKHDHHDNPILALKYKQ